MLHYQHTSCGDPLYRNAVDEDTVNNEETSDKETTTKTPIAFNQSIFKLKDESGEWKWVTIGALAILAWVGYTGWKKGWFKMKL